MKKITFVIKKILLDIQVIEIKKNIFYLRLNKWFKIKSQKYLQYA